jgi:uncharacterized protein YneF (UPF0154 family)
MARIKPKPTKLQQIIEFPLVILGGIIEGCEFIARKLKKKSNSDPVADLAVRMFFSAQMGADEIRKLANNRTLEQPKYGLNDQEWLEIFTEFQNVYLHIVDREAYARLGDAGRYKVAAKLVMFSIDSAVEMLASDLRREARQAMKKAWVEKFNSANQRYGRCKKILAMSAGEPPDDAVFRRFGAEVAAIAGRPGNERYIQLCREHATNSCITLLAKKYVDALA